jgi:hypothetical protein
LRCYQPSGNTCNLCSDINLFMYAGSLPNNAIVVHWDWYAAHYKHVCALLKINELFKTMFSSQSTKLDCIVWQKLCTSITPKMRFKSEVLFLLIILSLPVTILHAKYDKIK